MEYIKRDIERKFLHMSSAFKAVMVVGARQVGKSTMLKHLAEDHKENILDCKTSDSYNEIGMKSYSHVRHLKRITSKTQ